MSTQLPTDDAGAPTIDDAPGLLQAAPVTTLGRKLADLIGEALSGAFGRAISLGSPALEWAGPDALPPEVLAAYLTYTVDLEIAGSTYPAALLLPHEQVPARLPAFSGMADLAAIETISRLLQELAEHLTSRLAADTPPPVRLTVTGPEASLARWTDDAGVAPGVRHLMAELSLTSRPVGSDGPGDGDAAETTLDVVAVIPLAALQALLGDGEPPAGTASGGSRLGSGDATDPMATRPPAAAAQPGSGPRPLGGPPSLAAGTARSRPTAPAGGASERPPQPSSNWAPAGTSAPAPAVPAPVSAQGARPAHFEAFDEPGEGIGMSNLDLLLDVTLRLSVELGRTQLTIKELLALGPSSVVELDTLAGEPVSILVNDRLIAHGEVVVVDENFGVRVTDIVSPHKRLTRGSN